MHSSALALSAVDRVSVALTSAAVDLSRSVRLAMIAGGLCKVHQIEKIKNDGDDVRRHASARVADDQTLLSVVRGNLLFVDLILGEQSSHQALRDGLGVLHVERDVALRHNALWDLVQQRQRLVDDFDDALHAIPMGAARPVKDGAPARSVLNLLAANAHKLARFGAQVRTEWSLFCLLL